jgi:hypothetical protein
VPDNRNAGGGSMDLRTRLCTSVAAFTALAERPAVWSRCTTRCALNSVVVAVDSFSLRGCQHGRGACSANTSRAAGHTCRGDDPVVARVSCWARPKMEWATARDAGADPQTAWSLLGSPTDSVTGSRIGWAAAE